MSRLKIKQSELDEMLQARDWSAKNGFTGSVDYYNDLLGFLDDTRRLPGSPEVQEDEREGRR